MTAPITPQIVRELTMAGDPGLSPDGSQLAFTRSYVDGSTGESRSDIVTMTLPDGPAAALTLGPRDSVPRFAPDGSALAFLHEEDRRKRQLWLISTSGGEARPLTALPGGVSEYCWSPNHSWLAFVSDVDPDGVPETSTSGAQPRVLVARRIRYRADTLGWRGDGHAHVFVVSTNGTEPRQLTDGDWDDRTPAWSPDGHSIAFVSQRRDDRDVAPYSEAYVIPAAGGPPACWSDGLADVIAVTWSADSERLAAIASDDEAIGATWQGAVFVLAGRERPRRLTPDVVKPAAGFPPVIPAPGLQWGSDQRIRFIGDERGESYLFEVNAQDGELRRIAGGGAQFTSVGLDTACRRAVLAASAPGAAGDLHVIDVATGSMTQVTDYNREYFLLHPPARMQKFVHTRGDVAIECRLLIPTRFDPSRQYPLIVDVHGGPHGAFYDTFTPIQQVLATAGYLVLLVNPRGSSTYGREFAKAVLEDWGGEDYLDIMAAVDEVCSRPYVDASRLGIHGYSYGGYMTAWVVGHETRFRAAVAGAPCIDLVSMYGTSDIGVSFGERQWGGTPEEAEAALRAHSPLSYACDVQTPVLLLHGEADVRCPIGQSEEYFVALKRQGKVVELVRFPDCSHLFLRVGHSRMREEYLARALEWFNRFLGD